MCACRPGARLLPVRLQPLFCTPGAGLDRGSGREEGRKGSDPPSPSPPLGRREVLSLCVREPLGTAPDFGVARGSGVKLCIWISRENTHFCKWVVGARLSCLCVNCPGRQGARYERGSPRGVCRASCRSLETGGALRATPGPGCPGQEGCP